MKIIGFKIKFQICLFFCLILAMTAHASIIDFRKRVELERCLINDWGVDTHTVAYLVKKFQPLIENKGWNSLIDDFIVKSKNLKIDYLTPREVQFLSSEDAVLCAPKHHLVIFENLHVRILWGSTLPGEREPLHVHKWKSLMVVLKPAVYKIEYPDGKTEIWNGEIGIYELPANDRYACTNIGNISDEMIRFEIKE